jgi:hypothetical protein
MVKFDLVGPGNRVILFPLLSRPVRAGGKQPVQHREEHRTLQIKLMFPLSGKFVQYLGYTQFVPEPFEYQCRAYTYILKDLQLVLFMKV